MNILGTSAPQRLSLSAVSSSAFTSPGLGPVGNVTVPVQRIPQLQNVPMDGLLGMELQHPTRPAAPRSSQAWAALQDEKCALWDAWDTWYPPQGEQTPPAPPAERPHGACDAHGAVPSPSFPSWVIMLITQTGWWLNWVILEVFLNLNNSMILWKMFSESQKSSEIDLSWNYCTQLAVKDWFPCSFFLKEVSCELDLYIQLCVCVSIFKSCIL